MRPTVVSIDTLLNMILALDKEQFAEDYPGLYLLAMGLLSTEQLIATRSVGKLATGDASEDTLPMRFGDHPRHDLQQPHPLAGHAFRLVLGPEWLTVGRGADNDICVPDESVSERHCEVQALEGGLVVRDLGSTNGTSINLQRLRDDAEEPVADGDMLTVGRYSFQLLAAPTLHSTLRLIRALDNNH
jgi:hypothetical protein